MLTGLAGTEIELRELVGEVPIGIVLLPILLTRRRRLRKLLMRLILMIHLILAIEILLREISIEALLVLKTGRIGWGGRLPLRLARQITAEIPWCGRLLDPWIGTLHPGRRARRRRIVVQRRRRRRLSWRDRSPGRATPALAQRIGLPDQSGKFGQRIGLGPRLISTAAKTISGKGSILVTISHRVEASLRVSANSY
jgi:hypothetical protein